MQKRCVLYRWATNHKGNAGSGNEIAELQETRGTLN